MKGYYIQETKLFCDFENHFPSNNQQNRKMIYKQRHLPSEHKQLSLRSIEGGYIQIF